MPLVGQAKDEAAALHAKLAAKRGLGARGFCCAALTSVRASAGQPRG